MVMSGLVSWWVGGGPGNLQPKLVTMQVLRLTKKKCCTANKTARLGETLRALNANAADLEAGPLTRERHPANIMYFGITSEHFANTESERDFAIPLDANLCAICDRLAVIQCTSFGHHVVRSYSRLFES